MIKLSRWDFTKFATVRSTKWSVYLTLQIFKLTETNRMSRCHWQKYHDVADKFVGLSNPISHSLYLNIMNNIYFHVNAKYCQEVTLLHWDILNNFFYHAYAPERQVSVCHADTLRQSWKLWKLWQPCRLCRKRRKLWRHWQWSIRYAEQVPLPSLCSKGTIWSWNTKDCFFTSTSTTTPSPGN